MIFLKRIFPLFKFKTDGQDYCGQAVSLINFDFSQSISTKCRNIVDISLIDLIPMKKKVEINISMYKVLSCKVHPSNPKV